MALEAAKKDVITNSETPRGLLRVTLAGIFGENYIAPVVMELVKKYPELKIELDFNSRIVDIIDEKFDVAIRFGHLQDSSLIAQKIASRREFVCASKSFLSTHFIQTPKDLTKVNCLGGAVWNFKKNGKAISVSVNGNLKTNNPRVLLKAALSGLGVIRLPGSYVFSDLSKGKLVAILEDYNLGSTDIWAVTPSRNEQNINVRVFIDAVQKALAEDYPEVLF